MITELLIPEEKILIRYYPELGFEVTYKSKSKQLVLSCEEFLLWSKYAERFMEHE